ncbi:MAG: hypothetical protein AAFX87_21755 [Bacteroidota bacterium]
MNIYKITILFIVLSISGSTLYAQDEPSVRDNFVTINFLAPGFKYERGLGATSTININPGLGFSFLFSSNSGSDFAVQPYVDVQLRKYYNLAARSALGKNAANNSGNFFALDIVGVFPAIAESDNIDTGSGYAIGPVWGMQRTYASGFNLSLHVGIGYASDEFDSNGATLLTGLTLGFALNRD